MALCRRYQKIMPELPDKLYFKIGEVARIAGVPPHVLRYWESEFTAIKPKRANSGQRLYRREDIERILQLRVLLHEEGYTLSGARKLLAKKRGEAKSQKILRQRTAAERLRQIKKEVRDIQKIVSL